MDATTLVARQLFGVVIDKRFGWCGRHWASWIWAGRGTVEAACLYSVVSRAGG